MPDFNDSALDTRLRRFLYIGKEKPEYQPGNWFVHNYYTTSNIPSIDELAQNPLKIDTIISSIVEAHQKDLVQNPQTLIFALAVCAQQDKSEILRTKAYAAIKQLCLQPENFILFIKFCTQISKEKGKGAWGHGLRNAVKNWYNSKNPMEIAKIVTQCKSRYGWKHKDIIKLAHLSSKDPDMKVVVEYILRGFKEMKQNSEKSEKPLSQCAEEIIGFLQKIEDFKHCEDETAAGGFVDSLSLTLDHVPGHLLRSEIVWDTLLSTMNLKNLLTNLQRIHNMGLLQPNTSTTTKVLDILSEEKVTEEKIHPASFLIAVRNYENAGKPLSFEKRKVKEQAKKPLPPPPEPNKKVIDALNKMLNFSFSQLQPTNVHYMITISTNQSMTENGCWHCSNVTAAEAGCLIALSLLRAEKNVTVARFTKSGIQIMDIDPNLTITQMIKKLEKSKLDSIELSKPIQWAISEKKSIDVFINITDQISHKLDSSEECMQSYRTKMHQPNAKLIDCAMCASSSVSKESYDKNILSICGFDEKVPKIIEAFARSYF